MKTTIIIVISLIVILLNVKTCENSAKTPVSKEKTIIYQTPQATPFKNPSLIYGSSFGHYFQALYRQNQFETMLRFTSDKSIKQFGADRIMEYYQQGFKLDYQLGKLSNSYQSVDTIYLTYSQAKLYATRRKIVIQVIIEHDTCKLLLNNIPIEFAK